MCSDLTTDTKGYIEEAAIKCLLRLGWLWEGTDGFHMNRSDQ